MGRSFARRMQTKFSDRTLPSNPAAACQISRGCGSLDPQGVRSAKQRLVADAVTGTNRSQPGKRSPGWPRSNRAGVHRVNLKSSGVEDSPDENQSARQGHGIRRPEPSQHDQFELRSKLISFLPSPMVAVKPDLSGRVYFSGTTDFMTSGAFGSGLYS